MRGETWVSLATCLFGPVVPLAWLGPHLAEGSDPRVMAGLAVAPFALVAGTAWAVRRDARASRVVVAVAVLNFAIGLAGWSWVASDPWVVLLVAYQVPGLQFLTWFGGAVLSGRRSS